MGFSTKLSFLAVFLWILGLVVDAAFKDVSFDDKYEVIWGSEHINFLNQRTHVQLWIDKNSGAGFGSKLSYGSGFFQMRIKLPKKDSAGVVTAFYLKSSSKKHDEVDFEFLGNREGKPITLMQTNVFSDGDGNREQRILLWFDPSAHYHTYKILWNLYQIVFYVDNIPIRVFRNATKYPKEAMKVEVSLWDGESWATDGGQTKTNWSHAPFIAQFQGFDFGGCPFPQTSKNINGVPTCNHPKYWWNNRKYSKLSKEERRGFERVTQKYMNYDYCHDKTRHPTTPPECSVRLINK